MIFSSCNQWVNKNTVLHVNHNFIYISYFLLVVCIKVSIIQLLKCQHTYYPISPYISDKAHLVMTEFLLSPNVSIWFYYRV